MAFVEQMDGTAVVDDDEEAADQGKEAGRMSSVVEMAFDRESDVVNMNQG